MKIALDVDGVLADVITSWLDYNNNFRKPILKSEITEWDFWKKFQIDQYDFYNELSDCWKSWQTIPPTENDLFQTTNILYELGELDIVTAREKSTDSYVKNWLSHHKIKYRNYVTVPFGPKKAQLDYDVLIDDSPLNAEKFRSNGKKFILYSQPWNKNFNNSKIKRISKLKNCIEIIRSFN